jgi:hypothetical protein
MVVKLGILLYVGWCSIHSYIADNERKEWITESVRFAVQVPKDKKIYFLKHILVQVLHSVNNRI